MADIATIWDPLQGRGDWALPSPTFPVARDPSGQPVIDATGVAIALGHPGAAPAAGLMSGEDLPTAVLISIFTDATAEPDDRIADGTDDPRGWWGDPQMGSRLWLRLRSKQTPQTLLLVKSDIEAALAWLMTDGVAAAVDVATEWTRPGVLGCTVTVRRRDGSLVAVSFEWAWKEL